MVSRACEHEGAGLGLKAEFSIMDEFDVSEADRMTRDDECVAYDAEREDGCAPTESHEATNEFRSWIDEHSPRDGSFWAIGNQTIPAMVEMLDGIDDAIRERDKLIESLLLERDELREKVDDLYGQAPSSWHYGALVSKYDSLKKVSERAANEMELLSQQLVRTLRGIGDSNE